MHCAAVQCARPGFDENWLRCCTANATSMCVPLVAYMIEPTAVRYGICAISTLSSSVVSESDFESITLGSRGVATGWASSRCKRLVIFSTYAFCDRDIVRVVQSHEIAIPSKKRTSPRSTRLKVLFRSFFRLCISAGELAAVHMSSTCIATNNVPSFDDRV